MKSTSSSKIPLDLPRQALSKDDQFTSILKAVKERHTGLVVEEHGTTKLRAKIEDIAELTSGAQSFISNHEETQAVELEEITEALENLCLVDYLQSSRNDQDMLRSLNEHQESIPAKRYDFEQFRNSAANHWLAKITELIQRATVDLRIEGNTIRSHFVLELEHSQQSVVSFRLHNRFGYWQLACSCESLEALAWLKVHRTSLINRLARHDVVLKEINISLKEED